jgi:hypothetical protein
MRSTERPPNAGGLSPRRVTLANQAIREERVIAYVSVVPHERGPGLARPSSSAAAWNNSSHAFPSAHSLPEPPVVGQLDESLSRASRRGHFRALR